MSFRSLRTFGVLTLLALVLARPLPSPNDGIDFLYFPDFPWPCQFTKRLVANTEDATQVATSIAAQDFEKIRLYEQYAAAAYCGTNHNPVNTKPQRFCEAENCPLVQQTTTVVSNGKFGGLNLQYKRFVAVDTDPSRRLIIIAFEGTDPLDLKQVRATAKTSAPAPTMVNYCQGCAVGFGYLAAFNEVREKVFAAFNATRQDPRYSGFQIVATGHSLGGSLATIAALELRKLGFPVHLATYGQPRTLNRALARFVSDQDKKNGNRNFRVTHVGDIIPSVAVLAGTPIVFEHTSPSYFITTNNVQVPAAKDVNTVTSDVAIFPASLDPRVARDAHRIYFNNISACVADPLLGPHITLRECVVSMGGPYDAVAGGN